MLAVSDPETARAAYREAEAALWASHGLDPIERSVRVADGERTVRWLEIGSGPPVIFIHGTPTAGGVFAPLVAELSGVTAVVVDRPGCGLSDAFDLARLTPERLTEINAEWLDAVIDSVGGGPVDVVGNSAGGMAALSYAAQRPERVRSLVLSGVPAVFGMRLPLGMRAATFRPVATAVVRHELTERDLRRSLTEIGHGDAIAAGTVTPEDFAGRIALNRLTGTYAHELGLLRRVATWRGLRREWAPGRAHVSALTMPSLWLVGDRDPFGDPATVRRWARFARDSEVVELAAGHQPWLDDPPGHARILTQFWATVPRVSSRVTVG